MSAFLSPEMVACVTEGLKKAHEALEAEFGTFYPVFVVPTGLTTTVWIGNKPVYLEAMSFGELRAKVRAQLAPEAVAAKKREEAAKLIAEAEALLAEKVA